MEALQFLAPFVKGSNVKPEEVYGNMVLRNEETNNSSQELENIDDNQSELSLSSEDFSISDRAPNHRYENEPLIPHKNSLRIEKGTKRKLSVCSSGNEEPRSSRKRPYYEDESRKMFLLSLLADVQKLSDTKMRIFRRGVLDILDSLFVEQDKSFMSGQVSSEVILPKIEPLSVE